jgi:hypothetical protein
MSQPKTIKAGFKAPPLDALSGRGPPTTKKRIFFDRNSPQAAIISYSLYVKVNDRKRVEEGFICRRGINKLLL